MRHVILPLAAAFSALCVPALSQVPGTVETGEPPSLTTSTTVDNWFFEADLSLDRPRSSPSGPEAGQQFSAMLSPFRRGALPERVRITERSRLQTASLLLSIAGDDLSGPAHPLRTVEGPGMRIHIGDRIRGEPAEFIRTDFLRIQSAPVPEPEAEEDRARRIDPFYEDMENALQYHGAIYEGVALPEDMAPFVRFRLEGEVLGPVTCEREVVDESQRDQCEMPVRIDRVSLVNVLYGDALVTWE